MMKYFPIDHYENFNVRLMTLCEYRGISTDAELARRIYDIEKVKDRYKNKEDFTERSVASRISKHKKNGNFETEYLKEYCAILGCDADYLIGVIDYPTRQIQHDSELLSLFPHVAERIRKLSDSERYIFYYMLENRDFINMIHFIAEAVTTYHYHDDIHVDFKPYGKHSSDALSMLLRDYATKESLKFSLQNRFSDFLERIFEDELLAQESQNYFYDYLETKHNNVLDDLKHSAERKNKDDLKRLEKMRKDL